MTNDQKIIKRIYTTFLSLVTFTTVMAQGWPANYDGVMLQGFYWDSYNDTKWTNLESQADELADFFDLIWIPQSGWCNGNYQMGYADIWWFNQKSAFGSADELKSMIQTFKNKGLLTIADVVINHKSGNTSWCDFPTETWDGQTMTWSLADICNTDECNKTANLSKWSTNGAKATGANDTGSDFDGSRDLDHTSANVQKNIKLYLRFLMEEMGYAGFRYDMTGGYAPQYTKIYNEAANPTYSVGEYWMSDGLNGLKNWIDGTNKTSAAFDFQLKWLINNAFNNNKWNLLANYTTSALIGQSGYDRYSVTFTDNHDTGRESGNMLKANIEAANAYILTMPGTPCVWLTHWMGHKTAIKKMILARKLAGINNQSQVLSSVGETAGYSVSVQGTHGKILLLLGTTTTSTTGYQLAVKGDNYELYVSNGIDISSINNIQEETYQLPDFVTEQEGTYAYFEAPTDWGNTINVWAWNNTIQTIYGGSWPGTASQKDITLAGTTEKGNKVYLWKNSTAYTPTKIIFNDGSKQTSDLSFTNGGYYTFTGMQAVVTGIQTPCTENQRRQADNVLYDLQGRKVSTNLSRHPQRIGIYVYNGKKVVLP